MQAIVLSRTNVREYDQVVSLYTKETGRQDALVRGVKKIVSKNTSNLEPFSYVQVELIRGKEFLHLTKVQPLHYFSEVRRDPWKSIVAQFAVSFIRKISQIGERDEKLFGLLYGFLFFLEKTKNTDYCTQLDAYVLDCFSVLGLAPRFDSCVVCGKEAKEILKQEIESGEKQKAGLYFAGGGLVCQNCVADKKRISEQVAECGIKGISNMQRILNVDWEVVERVELPKEEFLQVHALVYAFALFHHEKHIVNWGAWFV